MKESWYNYYYALSIDHLFIVMLKYNVKMIMELRQQTQHNEHIVVHSMNSPVFYIKPIHNTNIATRFIISECSFFLLIVCLLQPLMVLFQEHIIVKCLSTIPIHKKEVYNTSTATMLQHLQSCIIIVSSVTVVQIFSTSSSL